MNNHRTRLILFIFLLCASLTSLCLCLSNEEFSDERVVELFKQWKEKHEKVYKDENEEKRRLENFRASLKFVQEKNQKTQSSSGSRHVVGLTKFADMSNEEFRQVYLSKVKRTVKNGNVIDLKQKTTVSSSCEAPPTLDWREKGVVTPVKDQGQCGGCWAFSTTGSIEGINAIVTGELISLSEQELVDCDTNDYGCDGGLMDTAFKWILSNGGLDTESDYPYTGYDGRCNTAKKKVKAVTIDGYKDIAEEESAILCALLNQPISVGLDGGSYDFQLYSGGIYAGDCSSDPNDINHAILIVGYGSQGNEQYWICKNSWGTSWGIDGYIYMKRNTSLKYGVCSINAMASYPTKGPVTPSPLSPPSPPTPPPPPPHPRPSPPPPSPPSKCGVFVHCSPGTTCCCISEFYGLCLIHGCCGYENAVCCTGTKYCCPSDYPICDVEDGLCLKSQRDSIGVAAKKQNLAKLSLPWTKYEKTENEIQTLQWKRNELATMR